MADAVNAERGNGGAFDAGKQDATNGIAQRVTVAVKERPDHEFRAVRAELVDGGEFSFVDNFCCHVVLLNVSSTQRLTVR